MNDIAPLWPRPALTWAAALCIVGLALLGAGYLGSQGKEGLDAQISWLNLAVAGSLLAATGQAGLIVVGRYRVAQLRVHVIETANRSSTPAAPSAAIDERPVTVPGATTYHHPSCLLAEGKRQHPLARPSELVPCEVCRP